MSFYTRNDTTQIRHIRTYRLRKHTTRALFLVRLASRRTLVCAHVCIGIDLHLACRCSRLASIHGCLHMCSSPISSIDHYMNTTNAMRAYIFVCIIMRSRSNAADRRTHCVQFHRNVCRLAIPSRRDHRRRRRHLLLLHSGFAFAHSTYTSVCVYRHAFGPAVCICAFELLSAADWFVGRVARMFSFSRIYHLIYFASAAAGDEYAHKTAVAVRGWRAYHFG